jgi:long-subunit acyl-CoA synthetase (AMP-forming)
MDCVRAEQKLEDVPEMGYFSHNEKGTPEGEVCVRGPGIFCGYYKDPEKTYALLFVALRFVRIFVVTVVGMV